MADRVALVRGIGSHNGGAELLLRATADRLPKTWIPAADGRRTSAELLDRWDVGKFWDIAKLGPARSTGWDVAPRALARRRGFFSDRHVDAVLDASGFFLSDQWSATAIARDAQTFARLARRGTPIVMLPQAFGPFDKPEVASAARDLLESTRLIFARDSVSLEHLTKLLGDDSRLRKAPDITIALDVDHEAGSSNVIGIVPNVNIPSRSSEPDARRQYVSALTTICALVRDRGYEPVVFAHSSHGDPGIVSEVRAMDPSIREFKPRDGVESKQFIGTCAGIIAGRYHAIVSALSQGVPAVAHSWSHKYGELLDDFDVDRGLADPFSAHESVELLDDISSDEGYGDRLSSARARLRESIEQAWHEVLDVLR